MTARPWRFGPAVALLAVVGFGVRLVAIFTHKPRLTFGDPIYYYGQAGALAKGHVFINALSYLATGRELPSALHPPLYTIYLAVFAKLGVTSIRGEEIATALLGTGTVVLVAFATRRLAGNRAGVIAGAVAAVYPILWSTDRMLLSEAMAAFVAAAIVLGATAYADRPTAVGAVLVGALVALLTLTRAEGLLLLAFLVVPLIVRARGRGLARARRWRHGALALGAFVVLVGPWVGFNLARFNDPTFISTNDGGVLADSYCGRTFNGPAVGWWSERCLPLAPPGDESQQDHALRKQAFDYINGHTRAVPRVMAFRVGRLLQVYRPWQTAAFEGFEGRGKPAADATTIGWFVVAPLGIAGVFVLAARRRPVLPVVALVAVSLVTAAVFYGSPRFRMVGEVALLIAAGAAVDALWSGWSARSAPRSAPGRTGLAA